MQYAQVSEVQIHLAGQHRSRAAKALRKQGDLSFLEALAYTGPHFKSDDFTGIEVAVGQSTINVIVSDVDQVEPDREYIYPLAAVARIKIVE